MQIDGFEPPTVRVSGECSTPELYLQTSGQPLERQDVETIPDGVADERLGLS